MNVCKLTPDGTVWSVIRGIGSNKPYDLWNAADVKDARRKRSGNRRLGLREGDADVRGLQGAAVVRAIAAEAARVVDALQLLHKLMLLIRRHSCIYLALGKHLRTVRTSGTPEAGEAEGGMAGGTYAV